MNLGWGGVLIWHPRASVALGFQLVAYKHTRAYTCARSPVAVCYSRWLLAKRSTEEDLIKRACGRTCCYPVWSLDCCCDCLKVWCFLINAPDVQRGPKRFSVRVSKDRGLGWERTGSSSCSWNLCKMANPSPLTSHPPSTLYLCCFLAM